MALVAKNFQDIITFSRASSGTYVNNNGYITNSSVLNYLTQSNAPETGAWAKSNLFVQQNVLTYSQDFDNAAWSNILGGTGVACTVTANQGIAPDGTLTADRIQFNLGGGTTSTDLTRRAHSSVTSVIGTAYTSSLWVRSYDGVSNYTIHLTGPDGSSYSLFVTGSWTRLTVTANTVAATASLTFGLRGGQTPTNSNTADLLVWGSQLVRGSVPGDYRATTTTNLACLYPDYNGALRARKLCEDNAPSQHITSQTIAIPANSLLSNSIYLKAGERTSVRLINYDAGSNYAFAYVNLANGTFHSTGTTGTASSPAFAITPVGDGWYRVSVVASLAATFRMLYLNIVTGTSTDSYTGDGSSGVYVADAQINDGSSTLAYYDTTGSASAYNAPRFDYDPVTLEAKGLLVEEIRANLLLQSNDFQTSWTPINITRTLNSILSPSGNVDGVKIEATAAVATILTQSRAVAATSATYSIYVKQGTGATTANNFLVRNVTTATNLVGGTINYSTGVWTYTTGSTGVVVSDANNGWWRLQISATSGITSGDTIIVYAGFVGSIATAGDFLYAYGAQLEAGAFATSYIPTVASQVTRAADLASVDTMSPWFNANEGTFYLDFSCFGYTPTLYPCAAQLGIRGTGSRGYIHVLNGPSTSTSFNIFDDAFVFQGVSHSPTYTTGARRKQAGAYAVNNAASSVDGTGTVVDTSVTLPTGINTLAIGVYASYGSNQQINGHIKRITYYPRRLSNAELQTLTTL